eukprot:3053271-Rhodomonas_salina.1
MPLKRSRRKQRTPQAKATSASTSPCSHSTYLQRAEERKKAWRGRKHGGRGKREEGEGVVRKERRGVVGEKMEE